MDTEANTNGAPFREGCHARPDSLPTDGEGIQALKNRCKKPRAKQEDLVLSETYGAQEGSAHNGHFGCTCYVTFQIDEVDVPRQLFRPILERIKRFGMRPALAGMGRQLGTVDRPTCLLETTVVVSVEKGPIGCQWPEAGTYTFWGGAMIGIHEEILHSGGRCGCSDMEIARRCRWAGVIGEILAYRAVATARRQGDANHE